MADTNSELAYYSSNTSLIRNRRDYSLSLCFSIICLGSFANNVSSFLFGDGSIYNTVSMILKVLVVFSVLFQGKRIVTKICNKDGLTLLLLFCFFIMNYFFSKSKIGFREETISFFLYVLPSLLIILCIEDYEVFLVVLTSTSKIICVVTLLSFFVKESTSSLAYDYDMGLANSLIVPCACLQNDFFSNKRKLSLVGSICLICICLIIGSRGALLGMLFFLTSGFAREFKRNRFSLKKLAFFAILIVAFAFIKQLVMLFDRFLNHFNIYSRTLWIFLNNFGHLSGREEIYSVIIQDLINHPFSFRGIGGSFSITNGFAHNLFLQILCENGVLFGAVLILIVLYYVIRTIPLFSQENYLAIITVIMFSASIPRLMFSGSLWSSSALWLWFVLVFRSIHRKKRGRI